MRYYVPIILSLLTILLLTGCSDNGTGPEPEVLNYFSISSPASVRDGESFLLTIQAVGKCRRQPGQR